MRSCSSSLRLRPFRYLLLAMLSLAIALLLPLLPFSLSPLLSPLPAHSATPLSAAQADQEGRDAFEAGRFQDAVIAFEQAIAQYEIQADTVRQAMGWGNLALAQQRLGAWEAANEAIANSLTLLNGLEESGDRLRVEAQVLAIAGQLYLEQGRSEQALTQWEQAAELYTSLEDTAGQWQSQIYQAQALQTLGFYRRAIELLETVNESLQNQPDSMMKAGSLQSLGDALRTAGNLERSRQVLEQGVAIARSLSSPDSVAVLNLSLANTLQVLGETDAALALYEEIAQESDALRLDAQLNQLRMLVRQETWEAATTLAVRLEATIRDLPPGRRQIYARIKYAENVLELMNQSLAEGTGFSFRDVGNWLAIAAQQAHTLGDRRAESYALGSLGSVYEQTRQYEDAISLTQQAQGLAEDIKADDLGYRWQWQLGRLLNAQGKREAAIVAYQQSVATLKEIRRDLVVINPEVQFTFQKSVEPIHRELVSLLLLPETPEEVLPDQRETAWQVLESAGGGVSPERLEAARQVLESLQQAELENFFREACLDAQPVAIDQIDNRAAILYPVILPERLEVIVRLPDRPLSHHTVEVTPDMVGEAVQLLRRQMTSRLAGPTQVLPPAQQIYDWLIRPIAASLQESGIETLVFVLDGALRNVPMAVLHDGDRFLVEQYSVALTPGLQLLAPRPLEAQELSIIAAGLTEARQGFTALPGVSKELQAIEQELPSQVLLNQQFTRDTLQQAIAENTAPVVHLATHGQFSSNLDDTFILTWGDRININQLSELLQRTDVTRQTPIELLVMSACQTASGDQRATLGLAGIAVRAGARSTLASLWSVDDQATSELMVHFYSELTRGGITKAEALRRAQVAVLQNPSYFRRPYYWAAFVLLGNWL